MCNLEILNSICLAIFQVIVFFIVVNVIIIEKIKYSLWDYIALLIGVVIPSVVLFVFFERKSLLCLVIGLLIFFYYKKKMIGIIAVLSSVLLLVICDFFCNLVLLLH